MVFNFVCPAVTDAVTLSATRTTKINAGNSVEHQNLVDWPKIDVPTINPSICYTASVDLKNGDGSSLSTAN